MLNIQINKQYIAMAEGTSEGTQIKYKKDNEWYKEDRNGQEGLAEYLASHLLLFSDLSEKEYILYDEVSINGKTGCRSKDFLCEDESLITFYRLYFNETGQNLSEAVSKMDDMDERIRYVIRFIKQTCNIDITEYLAKVFTLDYIILNEDRHFNNLAVIMKNDKFYPAPIFDNGVSLLTANRSVNWNFSISENVKRVIARPFSGSHEKMYQYFGKGFQLDIDAAVKWLAEEPESKCKEVLMYQLEQYKKICSLCVV